MVPQLLGTRTLRTRWMGLRSRFPWTRLRWRTRIRRWTRLLPRLRWRICPRLVRRWLRARWFQWRCARRWRRIPRRWRWIPRWRTPTIVAQTCRERDEPGWLPKRPAAFGGDEFCACVVSANSTGFPRVLSASGFVSALSLSRAGVPADVRNRQKAPVRSPSPTFVGCCN
jgi:hypothetical protein